MRQFDPQEFNRKKRLILVALGISAVIQLVILLAYYFKEQQVALTMPMILGLLITFYTMIQVYQIDQFDR